MPKMFPILMSVEESQLGPVMNLLHRTPGVAKLDLVLGDTPHAKAQANGHANGHSHTEKEKPKLKRFRSEVSGQDAVIKLLKGGPRSSMQLKKAFVKEGRKEASVQNVVFLLKQDGVIENANAEGARGAGFRLTKKGRDKLRYVK